MYTSLSLYQSSSPIAIQNLIQINQNNSNYYDNISIQNNENSPIVKTFIENAEVLSNFYSCSNILQLDGNMSDLSSDSSDLSDLSDLTDVSDLSDASNNISVIVGHRPNSFILKSPRKKVLAQIRRSNKALVAINLPTVININPRSVYNKIDEFHKMVEQYEADLIIMSESWERENEKLDEIIKLEGFEIITNVVQRENRGGKPAIIVDSKKFYIKRLCPDPITVPINCLKFTGKPWLIITRNFLLFL